VGREAALREDRGRLVWGPLVQGVLIRRYKRFLADVRLRNGRVVTAHCPNTGSMLGCSEPGRPVYLSRHNHPARRLKYTWEIIEMPTSLVGINTIVPNRLIKIAVQEGFIQPLAGYSQVRSEVRTGAHSRLDLLLENEGRRPCFVEVKNCTLVDAEDGGVAYFPDAVTTRGQKHLMELSRLIKNGNRGVMVFLIQRMDARVFRPARHIDPEYSRILKNVVGEGVEVLAYDVRISLEEIIVNRSVPVEI